MQHRNAKDIELLRRQLKIMSVDDVSSWLAKFSTSYYVNNDIDASKLLNIPGDLLNIEDLHKCLKDKSPEEINADQALVMKRDERDRLSNELTMNLLRWIQSRRFANVKGNYESALYEAALTLANLNPANTIDFATQEPISPEKRVVTSDRFQHDIDSLQTWLRHHNKNPWTNLPFSDRDITTITLHLLAKKLNDPIEKNTSPQYQGGDPDLGATVELARQLNQPEADEPMIGFYDRLRRHVGFEPRGDARQNINWPFFSGPRNTVLRYDSPPPIRRQHLNSDADIDLYRLFRDHHGTRNYQHSPIADLPTQHLPEWLTDNSAVKLSNGNFAVVKCGIWRNTNEETRQIKIIDPVSNQIVKTIQDSEPAGHRKLVELENDHIALVRLDIYDTEHCNINIYNTETSVLAKSITKDFFAQKLITMGTKLITSDGWYPSKIGVFDIETSRLSRQIETDIKTDAIFTLDSSLVAIGKYQNHDQTVCRIYDQEFNIVNQFNLNCSKIIYTHALIGNCVALSHSETISIINLETQSTYLEIAIPQTERNIHGIGSSNIICSMVEHENGNLIVADFHGIINEYSRDGVHLHMARTNLCEIRSPDALKLAYDLLAARHALQAVPVNPEPNEIDINNEEAIRALARSLVTHYILDEDDDQHLSPHYRHGL
jgi:hypothetical protein